jgi:hypothetical protein
MRTAAQCSQGRRRRRRRQCLQQGVLFKDGRIVGYCDVSQASVGLQLGAQSYTEIICFEDQKSFDRFKSGNFAFDAQAQPSRSSRAPAERGTRTEWPCSPWKRPA